jgi:hypothetical protein
MRALLAAVMLVVMAVPGGAYPCPVGWEYIRAGVYIGECV